jgi:hypothetical protein
MKIQSVVVVARLFLSQKFTGVKPNPRSRPKEEEEQQQKPTKNNVLTYIL